MSKIRSDVIYRGCVYIILTVMAIFIFLPVWLVFSASITENTEITLKGYSFWPEQFSLSAYSYILMNSSRVLNAYKNSVLVTLIGTVLHLFLTATYAYPLSRRDFKYRKFFTFFVFFTMLFNGGVVPSYLLWSKYIGIGDTLWAMIFPNFLMSAFNVLLVRNYYMNTIPESILEAARIDGASEIKCFCKIVLPLSGPVLATITLMVSLTYWNDWTNSLYYISSQRNYNIQYFLMQLMSNVKALSSGIASDLKAGEVPSESLRMAVAFVGILPVLIIYPFIQKYLIKGTVLGAVKG
ncbi:MAG: carbohydrate ABC transporter permease [Lachnospiraceae bacterium]